MNPVLGFGWGELQIYTSSYRFFFLLAALAAFSLGWLVAIRRKLPQARSLVCLLATAAAVPIGARLLDGATKPELYAPDPASLLKVELVGQSMYGGLLLAGGVGVLLCRLLSVDLAPLADSVAPGLGVGIALMRVGCFEAGCCFGRVTDLPWGVTFPVGSEAHLHQILEGGRLFSIGAPLPVHPTQLYEAAAGLTAGLLAAWLMHRKAPDGTPFLAAVVLFDGFRMVNHFLRVPGPALVVPEWFYPALYGVVLLLAGGALAMRLPAPSFGPRLPIRRAQP